MLLHHSVAIGYRNTVIWLLFIYLLCIYLFQRLKQPWKKIICLQGYELCEFAAQVTAFYLEVFLPSPAPFHPLTQLKTLESDKIN